MVNVQKLKELAEKVYLKTWFFDEKFGNATDAEGNVIAETSRKQFGEFIAYAHPKHILELLSTMGKRTVWVIKHQPSKTIDRVLYLGGASIGEVELTENVKTALHFADERSAVHVRNSLWYEASVIEVTL